MSAPPSPLPAAVRLAVHDLGNALTPLVLHLDAPLPADPAAAEALRQRLLRAVGRLLAARAALAAALDG